MVGAVPISPLWGETPRQYVPHSHFLLGHLLNTHTLFLSLFLPPATLFSPDKLMHWFSRLATAH